MKTIRPLPTEKKCSRCGEVKPVEEFGKTKHKDSPRGFYYRSMCLECNREYCREYSRNNRKKRNERLKRWRRENPADARDRRKSLMKKYNMTPHDYKKMFNQQHGKCLICGRGFDKLVIDHNHSTGQVRGLLCRKCNGGVDRREER